MAGRSSGTATNITTVRDQFKIEDLVLSRGVLLPGESVQVSAKIRNQNSSVETVRSYLGVQAQDGTRIYIGPIVSENVSQDEPAIVTFEWTVPSDFEAGMYDLTIDTWNQSELSMYDTTGFNTSLEVIASPEDILQFHSWYTWNEQKGILYGDFGSVNEMPGSTTIPYYIGWLKGSVVPVADVAADARDCYVQNTDEWANWLDCGGFVLSAIGSGGTVAGAIGFAFPEPVTSGGGIAVGTISFGVDLLEDISDVARITLAFVRKAPEKASAVGDVLLSSMGLGGTRRVLDEMPGGNSDLPGPRQLEDAVEVSGRYRGTHVNSDVILTNVKYTSKIEGRMTKDEVKNTVEFPDRVYRGTTEGGEEVYGWARKENGEMLWVQATDETTTSRSSNRLLINDGMKLDEPTFEAAEQRMDRIAGESWAALHP